LRLTECSSIVPVKLYAIVERVMAKQPSSRGGASRIRFIMLDAEIPEGDLGEITTAIQNALKPAAIIQQRLPSQQVSLKAIASNGSGAGSEAVDEQFAEAEDEEQAETETPRMRESRPRKPTVPKVLELDLTSGVSLESFAKEHLPKTEPERALVVAAYFKEHRGEDAITVNHVYTCYRAMKWPSGIEDFSWPLRYLKKEQLMASPGRGQYAINHLGVARVQKLGTTEA
jgi:hypothetical protein